MLLAAAVAPTPELRVTARFQFDHSTGRAVTVSRSKLKQLKSTSGSPVMDVSSHHRVSGNVFFSFFRGKKKSLRFGAQSQTCILTERRAFETAGCLWENRSGFVRRGKNDKRNSCLDLTARST